MEAIGVDVGFSHVKAWAKKTNRAIFPSIVGRPIPPSSFSLQPENGLMIRLDDQEAYTPVGETALLRSQYSQGRRDPSWVQDEEWFTLLATALSEVTDRTRVDIVLTTGLPVQDWQTYQPVVQELLRNRTITLQRRGREKQSIEVVAAIVATQPYGSLVDLALDEGGVIQDNEWASGLVGVADIGGNTLNLLVVDCLDPVERWTVSDKFGLLHALDNVRDRLQDVLPFYEPNTHEVASALAKGTFRYRGEDVDIWPYAKDDVEGCVSSVLRRTNEVWTQSGRLDAVLLTGGGSSAIGKYLQEGMNERYANVHLMEDARWGNVRGYKKLAERMRKKLGG